MPGEDLPGVCLYCLRQQRKAFADFDTGSAEAGSFTLWAHRSCRAKMRSTENGRGFVRYQENGNIRPARPIVESMPAAMIEICACIPCTSLAIIGSAPILAFMA